MVTPIFMEVQMHIITKLFKSRDKPTNYLGGLSFLFGQTASDKPVKKANAKFNMYIPSRIITSGTACDILLVKQRLHP